MFSRAGVDDDLENTKLYGSMEGHGEDGEVAQLLGTEKRLLFHVGCGLPIDGTLALYGFHADKVQWLWCGSVMGRGKTFELVVVLPPCMDGACIVLWERKDL